MLTRNETARSPPPRNHDGPGSSSPAKCNQKFHRLRNLAPRPMRVLVHSRGPARNRCAATNRPSVEKSDHGSQQPEYLGHAGQRRDARWRVATSRGRDDIHANATISAVAARRAAFRLPPGCRRSCGRPPAGPFGLELDFGVGRQIGP